MKEKKNWLRFQKMTLLGVLDIVSVLGAYFLALLLRFEFKFSEIPDRFVEGYLAIIPFWCVVTVVVFFACRLYRSILGQASVAELEMVIVAYVLLLPCYYAVQKITGIFMPRSYYVMGYIVNFCLTAFIRFAYRLFLYIVHDFTRRVDSKADRIMVIGAGSAGQMLIKELQSSDKIHSKVCCVIDDDPNKTGRLIEGVEIVGDRHTIVHMAKKHKITRIIYCIPSNDAESRSAILNLCKETNCRLQTIPGIYQLVNDEVSISRLRDVDVTDLLGRDQVEVNNEEILADIAGKVILVTGGGGSIGSELCRQIARAKPEKLIIFDIYENNAYDIQMELRRSYPELRLEVLIGSVRNMARLDSVLSLHKPDLVFHAAAHKHVPLMEDSPNEAIKNNVFGTYNMARAASKYGVKRFVLISTDKAVNPTNIMGASKRLCEMVVQMMDRCSDTEFVAVRFGNVLGSNGSVIPLFKKQIEAGGPVTVTHPDIIRYFMTIPEAVSLVLQAGYYARGGEIFVLDMGEPVKIDTMARNMIRLSGYEPDVDIMVKYTGLRPGEKLFEELLMEEEGLQETENKLIHIGKPIVMDDALFRTQLEQLEQACTEETSSMKALVASIIPTYVPKKES